MASYQVRLDAVQSAMVDMSNPNTNYSGASYYWEHAGFVPANRLFLIKFSSPDSRYNGKQIESVNLNLYVSEPYGSRNGAIDFRLNTLHGEWQEETVTYKNSPYWNTGSLEVLDNNKTISLSGWNTLIYQMISQDSYDRFINYGIVFPEGLSAQTENGTFYLRKSAYVPYILLNLRDPEFQLLEQDLSPISGYAGKHTPTVFSFVPNPIGHYLGGIAPEPTKILFRWRTDTNGEIHETELDGSARQYTVPAETFVTDSIQWQVVAESFNNTITTSNWYTLTTIDSTSTAEAVSPNGIVVDGASVNRFSWRHIVDTGTAQSKYDVQYSTNGGTSWADLSAASTSATYADIPANTLPSGAVVWRVRTYNADGIPGEWSNPAQITVKSAPSTPSITSISTDSRPIIRWQSSGQESYELQVFMNETILYETGETAGTLKEHHVRDYLANGVYTVRLRIKNSYNLFSPWAVSTVQINQTAITAPSASITSVKNGISIRIANALDYAKLYILRDGVPVTKLTGDQITWEDYAAIGKHSYIVRGVDENDHFSDSPSIDAVISVKHAVLASENNLSDMVQMIYQRDRDPNMTETVEPSGSSSFYAGRSRPVYEFYEFSNVALTWSYSYRNKTDLDKLRKLVDGRCTVRYRDSKGESYWCVLTSLQTSRDYLSRDFTLAAIEVDYVERINYDMEV